MAVLYTTEKVGRRTRLAFPLMDALGLSWPNSDVEFTKWANHAVEIQAHGRDHGILAAIMELLTSEAFVASLPYSPSRRYRAPPLSYMASKGLDHVVSALLDQGHKVNSVGGL